MMTGNEIIQALATDPGAVLQSVSTIASAIFAAIFLRKNTSTKEFEKLKAGKLNEVAETLLKEGVMTHTEFYKANNFLMVAKKADDYYKKMSKNENPGKRNFDWFIRYYEAVGNISDSDMQNIWAQILAREVDTPNTFSLKTIETLKNMGKKEAELFTKIVSNCILDDDEGFLPKSGKYLEENGIDYGDIMYMSEFGLMYNDSSISLSIDIEDEKQCLWTNDHLVMVVKKKSDKPVRLIIRQYPLTKVGVELASLIEEKISDEKFTSIAREYKETYKEVELCLYNILNKEGSRVSFDDNVNLFEIFVRDKL